MTRTLIVAAVAALATACSTPALTPPAAPTDSGYTQSGMPQIPSVGRAGTDQHLVSGQEIAGQWWDLFHSDVLDQLIAQAVEGNRTLAAATASMAEAHEAVTVAAGGYYPRIDMGAMATRQRNNFEALGITGLFPPREFNVYTLGPTVSYNFNFAGLTGKQVEQEQALEEAQQNQVQAAYLTLTASATTEAITIASLHAQLDAVNEIQNDDRDTVKLVGDEMQAGAATDLDVETANSQLASDATLAAPLRQQLSVAQHALAVLVGKTPAGWTPPEFTLAALVLPADLPVSLPSSLVHQRPDILVAESQLHAASAGVGIANAQLYPSITLTADVLQQFLKPNTLFDPISNIWSLGGALSAPIFHGGELKAQERAAVDAYNASLANYQQTVLSSFGQVADVLDGLAHDSELLAAEQTAFNAASSAVGLTRTSFQLGSATSLQVVDAQRQLEEARLGLVRAQAQRYLDTTQLFVAMGGGWWNRQPAATADAGR